MALHNPHFITYLTKSQTKAKLQPMNCHIIYYGKNSYSAYKTVLKQIVPYSPSKLKYERKICIFEQFDTNNPLYITRISDVHIEIDMSTLGCKPKVVWNEIYKQTVELFCGLDRGFIICTNFHSINSDLLNTFHVYMQSIGKLNNIVFVLMSDHISFMSENILSRCKICRCVSTVPETISAYDTSHESITNNIINITTRTPHRILELREHIYNVFIYNLNIYSCVWQCMRKYWMSCNISNKLLFVYEFFKYYNNNYRPIFHAENFFLKLLSPKTNHMQLNGSHFLRV